MCYSRSSKKQKPREDQICKRFIKGNACERKCGGSQRRPGEPPLDCNVGLTLGKERAKERKASTEVQVSESFFQDHEESLSQTHPSGESHVFQEWACLRILTTFNHQPGEALSAWPWRQGFQSTPAGASWQFHTHPLQLDIQEEHFHRHHRTHS